MTSASSGGGGAAMAGFKVYGSLFKVDARYQFLNALGKGSYGIVCAAKDKETGQCVAIKKVSPMAKRTVDAKHTLREVLLLQYLGTHPNIMSVHNLSTNVKDDELYIVMDLMDTDLHRVIQSSQPLSEAHVKFFLHQLLRGVKYLHDNGVLHRDLKPGNLLLTKTCQLKIADFGLARKMPKPYASTPSFGGGGLGLERPRSAPAASGAPSASRTDRAPMTEHVVTRWYRAPELMLQPDGLYDRSVDMWSVGCIFAEILGRKALFPGKNFMHQLSLIFDVIGTPPTEAAARIKSAQAQKFLRTLGKRPKVPFGSLFPSAGDLALDLLDKLLEFDPSRRISADDALAHPYLSDVDKKHRGGGDPHPPLRVDFSFDSKNLTKTDLRAMIIKEVDRIRKLQAGGGDLDAAPEAAAEPNERPSQVPRAMCGAAGSSLMRAAAAACPPAPSAQTSEQGDAGLQPSVPNRHPPAQHPGVVTLGSRRHRIRTLSKPPVPRRPSSGGTAGQSGAVQGNIRVASTAATQHLLAQSSVERHETGSGGQDSPELDPSSTTRAIAAALALAERSKALIASLSTATAVNSAASCARRDDGPKREPSPNPESPASSSSSSGPGSPPTSHDRTSSSRRSTQPTTPTIARRRVASAGPLRARPILPGASTASDGTFVGTTSSLIRAQRAGGGQTLTESANRAIAAMAAAPSSPRQANDREEDERVERPSPPKGAPTLPPQRSTSQLHNTVGDQPHAGARKPTKRLTVPRSPKFSIMSWQKKRGGGGYAHASGGAPGSHAAPPVPATGRR